LQFRTQQGIQSGINPLVKEQENFITGLNRNYVAQQLGLNVDDAQYIRQQADKYNQNINEIQGMIASGNQELNNLNNAINNENAIITSSTTSPEDKQRARINIERFRNQAREREQAINRDAGYLQSQKEGRDVYLARNQPILDKLNTYNQNVGLTREQLLQQYDLNRLARVQALQSLSGLDLSSLLSQGVS
jgi:chromosome segregation ATPase